MTDSDAGDPFQSDPWINNRNESGTRVTDRPLVNIIRGINDAKDYIHTQPTDGMTERATHIINTLKLLPHPEGGYYGEVYRSSAQVRNHEGNRRPALTTIHFLLTTGEHSAWHVLQSDEIWHHYEGDPLELLVIDPETMVLSRKLLGPLTDVESPVHTVPAGHWQAATSLGAYTLVGCTVAPGFAFQDFSLLRDNRGAVSRLHETFESVADLL